MTMIAPPPIRPTAVPPLRNGHNLTVAEFERRYDAMPPDTRAELIEGVVYLSAALSHDFHSEPHFDFIASLGLYKRSTPGVVGGDNGTCRLGSRGLPQPDIHLMIAPGLGGTADVADDGYVAGPPELIVEVAHTSAAYDLHQKMDVYRRNGVPEYVVWRTLDAKLDCFVLDGGGVYRPVAAGPDGLHADWGRVDADIRQGLASADHATFAADLARRRAAVRRA